MWEWEFAGGAQPRELLRTTAISERLPLAYDGFTGHDSWDDRGRFAFTAFGGEAEPTPHVYLVRIDPVRMKAGLGLLPGVPEVSVRGIGAWRRLVRTGDLTTDLDVIVETRAGGLKYHHIKLPAGRASARLPRAIAALPVRVVPDGDTYVAFPTRNR